MSKCESSARVRRVSSHAMSSTSLSTRSARVVMSSRFPIGVPTTYKVPTMRAQNSTNFPHPSGRARVRAPARSQRRWIDVPSAGEADAIESWGEAATSTPKTCEERRKGGQAPLRGLRRLLRPLGDEDGTLVVHDHLARDHALLEALDGGQLVHDLEHHLFQDGAQPARAGAALEGLAGDAGHRVVGELEAHLLEVEVLLVLLDDGVLGLAQDAHEGLIVEVVEGGHHG